MRVLLPIADRPRHVVVVVVVLRNSSAHNRERPKSDATDADGLHKKRVALSATDRKGEQTRLSSKEAEAEAEAGEGGGEAAAAARERERENQTD